MVVEYKGFRGRWNANYSSSNMPVRNDQDDPELGDDEEWSHVKLAETSDFDSEPFADDSGLFGEDATNFSDFPAAPHSLDIRDDLQHPVLESEGGHNAGFAKDLQYVQPRPKSSASKSSQPSWISSDIKRTADEMASRCLHKSVSGS